MPVVGFLSGSLPDHYARIVSAFRKGLAETGYVEGQNVAIQYRWAEGQNDRLPALAAELVRRQVAVIIVAGGTSTALAAKAATAEIPIIFSIGADPVRAGVVANIGKPEGNVTGFSTFGDQIITKRLQLLSELVPTGATFAVLINPSSPNAENRSKDMKAAARALGRDIEIFTAGTERALDEAFTSLTQKGVGALVVQDDTFFGTRRDQIVALAASHRVPAIYEVREYTAAGGLMSYGLDEAANYVGVGIYTGRILKGEKPANLPIQFSAKFQMIINLKTAKTLGLDVPASLLAGANELIE